MSVWGSRGGKQGKKKYVKICLTKMLDTDFKSGLPWKHAYNYPRKFALLSILHSVTLSFFILGAMRKRVGRRGVGNPFFKKVMENENCYNQKKCRHNNQKTRDTFLLSTKHWYIDLSRIKLTWQTNQFSECETSFRKLLGTKNTHELNKIGEVIYISFQNVTQFVNKNYVLNNKGKTQSSTRNIWAQNRLFDIR